MQFLGNRSYVIKMFCSCDDVTDYILNTMYCGKKVSKSTINSQVAMLLMTWEFFSNELLLTRWSFQGCQVEISKFADCLYVMIQVSIKYHADVKAVPHSKPWRIWLVIWSFCSMFFAMTGRSFVWFRFRTSKSTGLIPRHEQ